MKAWLYQMTIPKWYPEDYRLEVWEGRPIIWEVGDISPRGQGEISPGDNIILFFSINGNDYPGIYGWGVIYGLNKGKFTVTFQVTPPSDYLKTDPIWDNEIEKLINKIRGKMRQKTMWGISRAEFLLIREKIRERANHGNS